MSAVADRANKYLQQNLVPGMSGVAQKEYNRRMDEATFPKEIKEHVEKSQGQVTLSFNSFTVAENCNTPQLLFP